MPHRLPAAILIQRDKPHPRKQQAICLEYVETHGFRVHSLCFRWKDCMGLVLDGTVVAVIAAVEPAPEVRSAIEKAGASLCVAREAQEVRIRRDATEIAANMYRRGYDTQEISAILRVNSGDVRRSLWRAGIRPRKSPE